MIEEGSDSEGELGSLFATRPEEQEVFYFCDITLSDKLVTFTFRFCNDHCFESELALDVLPNTSVMRTLFAIGMCVCSWYWMGYNTSQIIICEAVCLKCSIGEECMDFWRQLYEQIALEFAYVNKTPLNLVEFVLEDGYPHDVLAGYPASQLRRVDPGSSKHRALIPMGGGKDSLVVWHQYAKQAAESGHGDDRSRPLLMYVADGMEEFSGSWRLQKLIAMTGDPVQLVRHDFQTQLFYRRKRSYLKPCAHPWAALVLFDSVLMAQLNGVREVRLGYERSADEGNGVFVEGREVNHQFDKSSAFLALAQAYVRRWIDPEVSVTSTLHGLWEIQIAQTFCEAAELRAYLPVFLSCNDPTEQCDWCKRCEKCAFIFLLLAAWLPLDTVVNTVFGGVNMLSEDHCRVLFRMLVGLEGAKPLDCVGTVAEACAAAHLAAARICASTSRRTGPGAPVCATCSDSADCAAQEESPEGAAGNRGDAVQGCGCGCAGSAGAAVFMPPLLQELCHDVHIEWDGSQRGPVLRDPDAILARWGVNK